MKLLKCILYLLLFGVSVWILAIFAGPSAIKKAVQLKFGDKITLYDVKVAPRLTVSVGRVEFNFTPIPSFQDQKFPVEGSVRAINFGVELMQGSPKLNIQTGSGKISETHFFKKTKATITPKSLFSWEYSLLEFNVQNYNYGDLVFIKNVSAKGDIFTMTSKVQNLHFKVSDFELKNRYAINLPSISGLLSNFEIGKPISAQVNSLKLKAENFHTSLYAGDIVSTQLSLENDFGTTNLKIEAQDVAISKMDILVDKAWLEGSFHFPTQTNLEGINYYIDNVTFSSDGTTLKKAYGKFIKSDDYLIYKTHGSLEEFRLVNDEFLIGTFPKTNFNVNLNLNPVSVEGSKGSTIFLFTESNPELRLMIGSDASLVGLEKKPNCSSGDCEANVFKYNFSLEVSDESLLGNVSCNTINCGVVSDLQVITSNTEKLLRSVSKSQLINPIFLAIVYGEFLKGEKIDSGHKLNL